MNGFPYRTLLLEPVMNFRKSVGPVLRTNGPRLGANNPEAELAQRSDGHDGLRLSLEATHLAGLKVHDRL